eukprot:2408013-Amphidinium_carterae.1
MKRYVVLNLNEVKKFLNVPSCSKKYLEGVPIMKLIDDYGQDEECYVFEHPMFPHREALVSRGKGVLHSTHSMEAQQMNWAGQ